MNPEQEKLLIDILQSMVESSYNLMGADWCKAMWEKIEKLKSVGKP